MIELVGKQVEIEWKGEPNMHIIHSLGQDGNSIACNCRNKSGFKSTIKCKYPYAISRYNEHLSTKHMQKNQLPW